MVPRNRFDDPYTALSTPVKYLAPAALAALDIERPVLPKAVGSARRAGFRLHSLDQLRGLRSAIEFVYAQHMNESKEIVKDVTQNLVGTPIFNFFQRRLNQRRQRLFEKFTERVANYVANGDDFSIEIWVEQNAEKEWFAAGIENGLLAIQNSIGENARRCLAVLVGHYLKNAELPDSIYKRLSRLFVDSDDSTLAVLRRICSEQVSSTKVNFFLVYTSTTRPENPISVDIVYEGDKVISIANPQQIEETQEAVSILKAHAIVGEATGLGASHPERSRYTNQIATLDLCDSRTAKTWNMLKRCLAAVRE